MSFRLEVKCYLLLMIGSLLLKICSRSVKLSPDDRKFECKSTIIFSSFGLTLWSGLENSARPLIFTSASDCRASGICASSSEN